MSEEQLYQSNNSTQESQEIEQNFHRDVLQQLWEMVKILKQEDGSEYRSQLQSYCHNLLNMGKQANLPPSWFELLGTADRALAEPSNTYRTAGKLIIKEIKQAADLVLEGRTQEIRVSEKLQQLAPVYSSTSVASGLNIQPDSSYEHNEINLTEDPWDENQNGLGLLDDFPEKDQHEGTQTAEDVFSLFEEENEEAPQEISANLDLDRDLFEILDQSGSEEETPTVLEPTALFDLEEEADLTQLDPTTLLDLEVTEGEIAELDQLEEISNSSLDLSELNELEDLLDIDSTEKPSSVQEMGTEPENLFAQQTTPLNTYEQFEELDALLESSPALVAGEINVSSYWEELEKTIESPATIPPSVVQEPIQVNQAANIQESEAASLDRDLQDLIKGMLPPDTGIKSSSPASKPAGKVAKLQQTMRVPVKQLDDVNNLIGELVVKRNSLEQDQERLHRFLDNLLNQVQSLSDVGGRMQELYERSLLEGALMASRGDNRSSSSFKSNDRSSSEPRNREDDDLDALELDRFTDFHLLSQEMIELIVRVRESASDIQFLVDETEQVSRTLRQVTTQLQEGMTKCRMVPFSQTADRLPRAIRDISFKLNKQAKLEVDGKEVLIDKMILDSLYDPMTHLVNNAMTHGVETPEERQKLGKSPQGQIQVKAFFQGNQTVISVSDDGAGINPEKVKTKAVQKGLIEQHEAKKLSKQEVYDLLFHPGFSTREQVDDLAGRGVGMDVVRNKINHIRGTISIDSNIGKGTTFTIRLPQTLSICKALLCINNHAQIAFPIDGVEDTQEFSPSDIEKNAEGKDCVRWRDDLLPFQPLSDLLAYTRPFSRSSVYGGKPNDDNMSIVVLRGAGKILAVQVDRVEGEQEIVIKQIQGPVPKPPGVAGATVLGDGRIMPIADVLELIEISQGIRTNRPDLRDTMIPKPVPTVAPKTEPMVLIVDDSITVRELLSLSFSKVGYRVEQARDGQEAWEKLRSGLPCDLIFCDIEMPRMNGLELLSNLQKDEDLAQIPVAMLTSRGAEKHQQLAAKLGASGYFVKPYTEKDLLDAAQRMVKGEILLGNSSRAAKATQAEPNRGEPTPAAPARKVTSGVKNRLEQRVLIVDDSVIVREMVSMTFSKAGYQVEQARDGQEAWEKLRSGLPCDLIVCDIEMPRMNGLEFLSHVQEDENLAEIPVAMLTSRGAQKMKKIAAQRGAKAYFVKPYVEETLLDSARRLLDGEMLLENAADDE